MAVAYLMLKHNLRFKEAHEKVEAARPLISINDGFQRQLKELESSLFGTSTQSPTGSITNRLNDEFSGSKRRR